MDRTVTFNQNKYLVMSPRRGSTPRQTDWLTVSRKVTLTLTLRLASVSVVPSSPLAAPLSARVRHGSSPTCEGSNSMHRRLSTLPAHTPCIMHHAATLHTVDRRLCRARTGRCQPTLRRIAPKEDRQSVRLSHCYPCEFLPASPARDHRADIKEDLAAKNAPFKGHNTRLQKRPFKGDNTGILQLHVPLSCPGHSDIITVINICYSIMWVSPWIPTSRRRKQDLRISTYTCYVSGICVTVLIIFSNFCHCNKLIAFQPDDYEYSLCLLAFSNSLYHPSWV
jgi:hypothetical protein